jgi:beta-glucosidase
VSPGTTVTCSTEGADEQGADLAIVVVGEEPYAEMEGDRTDLTLNGKDAGTVSAMKAAGLPVIVLVLSGRPLVLGEVAEQADAIVAAWLPGSEGDGIADVLFGKTPFTGKLSFSWPKTMAQIPASRIGKNAPLFPLGFGLTH